MDVKHRSRITTGIVVAVLSVLSLSQARPARYDPAGRQRPPKAREEFLDFTLKRINPSDKDYGEYVDQSRAVLLDETVRNGYFWSNLVALGALGCLLGVIIFQHRIEKRREWVTAETLVQFDQSLQRANAQANEATLKNQAINETLARLRESALQSVPKLPDSGEITGSTLAMSRATPPAAAVSASMTMPHSKAATRNDGSVITVEPTNQMALFKADAAVIMKVNALEQQLARAEAQQKELRRQLNEATRKLQVEQEKNRALKGA